MNHELVLEAPLRLTARRHGPAPAWPHGRSARASGRNRAMTATIQSTTVLMSLPTKGARGPIARASRVPTTATPAIGTKTAPSQARFGRERRCRSEVSSSSRSFTRAITAMAPGNDTSNSATRGAYRRVERRSRVVDRPDDEEHDKAERRDRDRSHCVGEGELLPSEPGPTCNASAATNQARAASALGVFPTTVHGCALMALKEPWR